MNWKKRYKTFQKGAVVLVTNIRKDETENVLFEVGDKVTLDKNLGQGHWTTKEYGEFEGSVYEDEIELI